MRLGLSGETDVVEFRRAEGLGGDGSQNVVQLEGREGWWTPFPVEYKRGRPRSGEWDEVQLCAQALCLEEMFGVAILSGALFYGKNRRRLQVDFDAPLRTQTEGLAQRMHELYSARTTPAAIYAKKCESCSLMELCMPRMSTRHRDVERYLANALRDVPPGLEDGV